MRKLLSIFAAFVIISAGELRAQKTKSDVDVIIFKHADGSPVKTFAGPFTIKEGANTLFSVTGSTLSIASAAGGSGTPCTTTANSVQYNNAGGFGCISTMTSDGTIVTAKAGTNFNFADPSDTTKKLQFNLTNIATSTTLSLDAAQIALYNNGSKTWGNGSALTWTFNAGGSANQTQQWTANNGYQLQTIGSGPIDINNSLLTTTSTTSVSPGTSSIVVGSTANYNASQPFIVEQYGAGEETIAGGNCSIVDATHFSCTFAKAHTQPYSVVQQAAVTFRGLGVQYADDSGNIIFNMARRNVSGASALQFSSYGHQWFSFPSSDNAPRFLGNASNGLKIYSSDGGTGTEANVDILNNNVDGNIAFRFDPSATVPIFTIRNSTNTPWKFSGDSDAARAYCGGTANACLFYGNQGGSGTTGEIAFRDNDTDNHQPFDFDTGTGKAFLQTWQDLRVIDAGKFTGSTVTSRMDNAITDCGGGLCGIWVMPGTAAGFPTSALPANAVMYDHRTSVSAPLFIYNNPTTANLGTAAGLKIAVGNTPCTDNPGAGAFVLQYNCIISDANRQNIWGINPIAIVDTNLDAHAWGGEFNIQNSGSDVGEKEIGATARKNKIGVLAASGNTPYPGTIAFLADTLKADGYGWHKGLQVAGTRDIGVQVTQFSTSQVNNYPVRGLDIGDFSPSVLSCTITTISTTSNVDTANFTSDCPGYAAGDTIVVANVANTVFNGTYTVSTAPSATQITYAHTTANASSTGGAVTRTVLPATIAARQFANNQDTLLLQRFTDTSPTGNFIRALKLDKTVLASLDVNGTWRSMNTGASAGTGPAFALSTAAGGDFWYLRNASTGNSFNIDTWTGAAWVTPLSIANTTGISTWGFKNIFAAATTSNASYNVPSGTAPTSPATGDIYSDGTSLFLQGLNYRTTGALLTGSAPPATTAGTAGYWAAAEGTAFTNAASAAGIYPDSTKHEFMAVTNGASSATPGMMMRVQPSPINQTAKTAAIATAALCASAAGACNTAGQYRVSWNFWGSGTACSSVTAGSVTFLLTWTDENAVTHSAVAMPMTVQTGAATTATQSTFPFQTALANESGSDDVTISTNGSVINYATGYTACTTGTGTYNLRASVMRLQ